MYIEQKKPRGGIDEHKERNMTTILKWIFGALLAGLAWLIGIYTDEYFRPYKKIRTSIKNK